MFSKEEVFKEIARRKIKDLAGLSKIGKIHARLFEKQKEVLDSMSTSRFIAINCTRRGGKSDCSVSQHLITGMKYPGSRMVMMGLTLDSIVEIAWDMFVGLSDELELNLKYNKQKRIIFFPNGSRTRFFGLDSSEKQVKKILGQKLRLCSIDEAGSLTVDMKKICYQMIMPALSDLRPFSWLVTLGTCEIIPRTFFEAITTGKERTVPWNVFRWTTYDNPHMKTQWTDEINELTRSNPEVVNASWFRTHYLNEWCTDDDLKIFSMENKKVERYDVNNWADSLWGLGVDLGLRDDTSFTVVCSSKHRKELMVVKSFKKTNLDLTDTSNMIKSLCKIYPIKRVRIDGANAQGVEEMRRRHNLPVNVESAEKTDKAIHLRLLADDVKTGMVVYNDKGCEDLIDEQELLIWWEKDPEKETEDPRCQNHCNDGFLYIWKEFRNYTYKKPKDKPKPGSEQEQKEWERKEIEEMKRKARQEKEEEVI